MSSLLQHPCLPKGSLPQLQTADQRWQQLKSSEQLPIPEVIQTDSAQLGDLEWDVVICGGTLGILLGAALVRHGWRVALLERGVLRGREQEWNISRQELQTFLDLDLLTEAQLDQVMVTNYNPARVGFHQGGEWWVRDVLNIGVDPVQLLELCKQRFLHQGGKLLEHSSFQSAEIHPDGVLVKASEDLRLKSRLFVDMMGHGSPIVAQARAGEKPDAVCLVVGGCAEGMPDLETGDLLYTFTPIQKQCQYFWEAFPAHDGRTTYLFTYLDLHPDRLTLTELLEDYLRLLPEYQGVDLDQVQFRRLLTGLFPAYRHSPLQSPWDRVLFAGDSSGSQSPLSFGGFGAMVRHLDRLDQSLHEALTVDALERFNLDLIQPYQPNLSVTWLFQESMSVGIDQQVHPDQINRLLSTVLGTMFALGDEVVQPFLQDVVRFGGLTQALTQVTIRHPLLVLRLLPQLGPIRIARWLKHFAALGVYSAMDPISHRLDGVTQSLSDKEKYRWHRWQQAWKYGSGGDYA